MSKYNYGLDFSFELITDKRAFRDISAPEILKALEKKLKELKENPSEFLEAISVFDCYKES